MFTFDFKIENIDIFIHNTLSTYIKIIHINNSPKLKYKFILPCHKYNNKSIVGYDKLFCRNVLKSLMCIDVKFSIIYLTRKVRLKILALLDLVHFLPFYIH